MPLKILHLADLNICHRSKQKAIREFAAEVQSTFKISLDIQIASEDLLPQLSNLITSVNPDILVVSGNITAFGDRDSFRDAADWIGEQMIRPSSSPTPRAIVVVPGTNDFLLGHLCQLRNLSVNAQDASPSWYSDNSLSAHTFSAFHAIYDLARQEYDELANDPHIPFHTLVEAAQLTDDPTPFELDDFSALTIFPYWQCTRHPLWIPFGNVHEEAGKSFCRAVDGSAKEGNLRLAVIHHNPVSSARSPQSQLPHAFTDLPPGPQFLKELQQTGIDIVLHGNQHESACLSFDFDLREAGHAYSIGCASSTAPHNASCNLLTIEDVNHATLTPYSFVCSEDAFEPGQFLATEGKADLFFERHQPLDRTTLSSRRELKRFQDGSSDAHHESLAKELCQPSDNERLYYISGRHLRGLAAEDWSDLEPLLAVGSKIRVLLSNPDLLSDIADRMEAAEKPLPNIWGKTETLRAVAAEAQTSLDSLDHFISTLTTEQRGRIEARLANTIIPFAATVRDADEAWGKMLVRILPMGAYGAIPSPVLRLSRRADKQLYDHFMSHLQQLLIRSEVYFEWDCGDADLPPKSTKQ